MGDRLVDPYPEDEPLFVITAENVGQYADKLSPGQIAMFERYPFACACSPRGAARGFRTMNTR